VVAIGRFVVSPSGERNHYRCRYSRNGSLLFQVSVRLPLHGVRDDALFCSREAPAIHGSLRCERGQSVPPFVVTKQ
jgi:hypothetical protein